MTAEALRQDKERPEMLREDMSTGKDEIDITKEDISIGKEEHLIYKRGMKLFVEFDCFPPIYAFKQLNSKNHMRYLLTLFTILALCFSNYAQKLEENHTDEFTKKTIKRTSWEKFVGGGAMTALYTNFRIQSIDTTTYFSLKMMMNNAIYSIDKDAEIIFLFGNGETVTIYNMKFEVACEGCGAVGFKGSAGYGTHTDYILNESVITKLKSNVVTKVRIHTNDGYIERELSEKTYQILKKALALVE